jgi:hypothetical protein
MCFDVQGQGFRVVKHVRALWTAYLDVVMHLHVDLQQITVLKDFVTVRALEVAFRHVLVLFYFVDLERTG